MLRNDYNRPLLTLYIACIFKHSMVLNRLTCLLLTLVMMLTFSFVELQIELKNPCREGKKLLVLDIDYTLFDHRSTAENPLELMRPCKWFVYCML